MAKAKKTAAPAASAPARNPATPTASAPVAARSPAAAVTPLVRPLPTRQVTREDIARRAYEIWVAKGRPTGQDLVNWQQAEKELLGH